MSISPHVIPYFLEFPSKSFTKIKAAADHTEGEILLIKYSL
jgi:hypothetical protein